MQKKLGCLILFREYLSEVEVKNLIDGVHIPPSEKTNKKLISTGYVVEYHWTHFSVLYNLSYWSSHICDLVKYDL